MLGLLKRPQRGIVAPEQRTYFFLRGEAMADALAHPTPRFSRALLLSAGALALVLAATFALWAHYGTAVFYEMIVAGIATCL